MKWLVVHKEMGIYVGSAMGLGFFSLLDCAGQFQVVLFPSIKAAQEHIRSWDNSPSLDEFDYYEVPTPRDYATVSDIRALGLNHLLGELGENELANMDVAGGVH